MIKLKAFLYALCKLPIVFRTSYNEYIRANTYKNNLLPFRRK